MAALKYWVWLTALPGLSNRSRLLLLEHFPSPEDIYYAQPRISLRWRGCPPSQAALLSDKSTDRAEDVLARCAKGGYLPADHAGRRLPRPDAGHL